MFVIQNQMTYRLHSEKEHGLVPNISLDSIRIPALVQNALYDENWEFQVTTV